MASIPLASLEVAPHRIFLIQEFHDCNGLMLKPWILPHGSCKNMTIFLTCQLLVSCQSSSCSAPSNASSSWAPSQTATWTRSSSVAWPTAPGVVNDWSIPSTQWCFYMLLFDFIIFYICVSTKPNSGCFYL